MTISEPMTLATDYLLAVAVSVFALRLWREAGRRQQTPLLLWAAAFFASAAAALAGGTFHGFAHTLGPLASGVLWKTTVYSVGLAGLFLLCGAAFAFLTGTARLLLIGLALGKFLVYAVWMATHDAFRFVIYDYAPSLLIVLLLQAPGAIRREASSLWIAGGILVSFVAAGIQAAGVAPHPQFNHNDLYHLVQLVAFWLLYRGGRLLRDRDRK